MLCINRPSANINEIHVVASSNCQKFNLAPKKLLPPNIDCKCLFYYFEPTTVPLYLLVCYSPYSYL